MGGERKNRCVKYASPHILFVFLFLLLPIPVPHQKHTHNTHNPIICSLLLSLSLSLSLSIPNKVSAAVGTKTESCSSQKVHRFSQILQPPAPDDASITNSYLIAYHCSLSAGRHFFQTFNSFPSTA
ncbi:unnamed protein product [Coffea canephora]|uniref:Uncharacterized protein n=1 Tax=Coffea canephora TaxID=49390 RepID=A0A068TVY3_COFCA|nr:unnamed protein product [Coffea canephora]